MRVHNYIYLNRDRITFSWGISLLLSIANLMKEIGLLFTTQDGH
jgi:hypothetical protein